MLSRFTTLAILLSALCLAGCGGTSEVSTETSDANADTTELTELEVTTPSESEASRDSAFQVTEESDEVVNGEILLGDPSGGDAQ